MSTKSDFVVAVVGRVSFIRRNLWMSHECRELPEAFRARVRCLVAKTLTALTCNHGAVNCEDIQGHHMGRRHRYPNRLPRHAEASRKAANRIPPLRLQGPILQTTCRAKEEESPGSRTAEAPTVGTTFSSTAIQNPSKFLCSND